MSKMLATKESARDREIVTFYKKDKDNSLRVCATKFGVSMQRIHQIILRDAPSSLRAQGSGSTKRQRVAR